MDDFLRSIIPNVSAQTADTVAQPTFGPINSGGGGTTTGASVLLTSDKTTAGVGEVVTVQVAIKTNDVAIGEYRIAIDFDPTLLRVIDEDTTVQGTQMKLLDTVFTITTPDQNNIVTSVGRARLIATAPSGTTHTVNSGVLQMRFQVQAVGSAKITIVQGTTGTQLIRQAGVGLTFTSNELTVQTTTASGNADGQGNNQGNGNTNNGNTTTTNPPTTGTTTGGTTPDTSISPGLMSIFTFILAIMSLLVGLSLKLTNRPKNSRK